MRMPVGGNAQGVRLGLWVMGYGLWVAGYRLRVRVNYKYTNRGVHDARGLA